MKNEYESAEVVEIGNAETVILGHKTEEPMFDFSGGTPIDREWVEG